MVAEWKTVQAAALISFKVTTGAVEAMYKQLESTRSLCEKEPFHDHLTAFLETTTPTIVALTSRMRACAANSNQLVNSYGYATNTVVSRHFDTSLITDLLVIIAVKTLI